MTDQVKTYEDIKKILTAKEVISFKFTDTKAAYFWIEQVFIKFHYKCSTKKEKGLILKYVCHMTGYSPRHVKRLAKKLKQLGCLEITSKRSSSSYSARYTKVDIELLARVDELHNNLNGLSTKKILEKEFLVHQNKNFARLAYISIGHIYNLRKTNKYRETNLTYTATKPNRNGLTIGEKRKPAPNGKPGYIRIDTVHQGDNAAEKGVYHIHAVDEVTQWDIVVSVEKISEAYMLPALEELLEQFPFTVVEFHSDNGSEYVNFNVAALLNNLLIKLTKSRSGRTNDNALVESKNCSIIRKNMGYGFIEQRHAQIINDFYKKEFNPYLNFFRPCLFPETVIQPNGKKIKKYRPENAMTPYEKLKAIPDYNVYLKTTFSIEEKDILVNTVSPNQFAERMVKAKHTLFNEIMKS